MSHSHVDNNYLQGTATPGRTEEFYGRRRISRSEQSLWGAQYHLASHELDDNIGIRGMKT